MNVRAFTISLSSPFSRCLFSKRRVQNPSLSFDISHVCFFPLPVFVLSDRTVDLIMTCYIHVTCPLVSQAFVYPPYLSEFYQLLLFVGCVFVCVWCVFVYFLKGKKEELFDASTCGQLAVSWLNAVGQTLVPRYTHSHTHTLLTLLTQT